jgi:bis(5'-nucleosidyl)-tetraphosphatase
MTVKTGTYKRQKEFEREFSAGAVIFYKNEKAEPLYLILHYHFKGDYWDFPRGNIEKGESSTDATKREIREETGLTERDIRFVQGFKETIQWFYVWQGIRRLKQTTYFLAETTKKEIKLSEEHIGYIWLPLNEALEQLTYKNTIRVLEKVNTFIDKGISTN